MLAYISTTLLIHQQTKLPFGQKLTNSA